MLPRREPAVPYSTLRPKLVPEGDRLKFATRTYDRVAADKPAPAPAKWRGLIGEYGWDHDVLYLREKDAVWCYDVKQP